MIKIEDEIEAVPTIREIRGLKIKEEEGEDRIQGLQEAHLPVEDLPPVHPGRQDEMNQIEKKVIICFVLIFLYF